jgi:hypothetical protein
MRSEPLESSADLTVIENSIVTEPAATRDEAAQIAESAVSVPVPVPVAPQRRRGLWAGLLSDLPLALVICGVGVGLVVIAMHHFRWGNLAISASVLAGAGFRLLLPTRRAGLLVVRSRFTDVLTMGIIGGALMVLALVTRT